MDGKKRKPFTSVRQMEHFSEVIKIIEAGLEGDRTKLIAYANLLISKVSEHQQTMIIDRITGEYKTKDILSTCFKR